jgi:pantoate--beta-alanine ligase
VETELRDAGAEIDYVEIRDAITLKEVSEESVGDWVLAVAAHVGTTRLIDNLVLSDEAGGTLE